MKKQQGRTLEDELRAHARAKAESASQAIREHGKLFLRAAAALDAKDKALRAIEEEYAGYHNDGHDPIQSGDPEGPCGICMARAALLSGQEGA